MKQFITRNRKRMIFRALYSAAIISICVYTFARVLFYEFPMTWTEEIVFFLQVVVTGSLLIGGAATIITSLYFLLLKIKQRTRLVTFKWANVLFLKKNRTYVQYPAYSN